MLPPHDKGDRYGNKLLTEIVEALDKRLEALEAPKLKAKPKAEPEAEVPTKKPKKPSR